MGREKEEDAVTNLNKANMLSPNLFEQPLLNYLWATPTHLGRPRRSEIRITEHKEWRERGPYTFLTPEEAFRLKRRES